MIESDYILVVDDSPTQLSQMQLVLQADGWNVETATNGRVAVEKIQLTPPILVVTDLQMPEMNGLELVAKLSSSNKGLPVVLTTGEGNQEIAAEALNLGAASYVPKDHMASMLAPVVRQVLAVNEAASSARATAKFATESTISLRIDSDESLVPNVIARLELPLVELDLFDEGERMQIAMALDEALVNAIIHGNLEVSSELREIDDGQPYMDLVLERKHIAPYSERKVDVRLEATVDSAKFIVTDEGKGFDASQLRDPTDPMNLEQAGGRGLLLINAFMDKVEHNEQGNQITMYKRKVSS